MRRGIQPSPWDRTRSRTVGPPPPIRTGGTRTGLGQDQIGEKSTNRPWNSDSSAVQIARRASTCSSMVAVRRVGSTPWCAISSAFHPGPTPSSTRPPAIRSRLAIVLASTIGSCCATNDTPVPSAIRDVSTAIAVSATNGS